MEDGSVAACNPHGIIQKMRIFQVENLKALIEMEDLAEDRRLLLIIILQIDGVDYRPEYGILASYFKHRNEIPGPTQVG